MQKTIVAFNKELPIDEDELITADFLSLKNWVGVPFSDQQGGTFIDTIEVVREEDIAISFLMSFTEPRELKAVMLDDGQYTTYDLSFNEQCIRAFIKENYIFDFLIIDSRFSWAYIHYNSCDAFILYASKTLLKKYSTVIIKFYKVSILSIGIILIASLTKLKQLNIFIRNMPDLKI